MKKKCLVFRHSRRALERSEAGRLSGFTLLELLVVIAVIGILIALLMPAIQQARAAARMTQCRNNLKQISLALHDFHDVEGAFPPARLVINQTRRADARGKMKGLDEPSWLVRILPFIEQTNLYRDWDIYEPYGENPEAVRLQPVAVFLCPDRHSPGNSVAEETIAEIPVGCGCVTRIQGVLGGAVTDYFGNHGDPSPGASGSATDFYWGGNGNGVLISSRPKQRQLDSLDIERDWIDKVRIADITDGTSNTLMVGEGHIAAGYLNAPPYNGPAYMGRYITHFVRLAGPGVPLAHHANDQRAIEYSFGSAHAGIVQFAMADGSVRSVSTSISTELAGRLANRLDGNAVDGF